MKTIRAALALASLILAANVHAITTNDIQLWAGSGTNRAGLVITWSSPDYFNYSSVPAPVANKTMVWGYQFNGSPSATEMLVAMLAADPRLYVVGTFYAGFGTAIDGIGYNLNGNGAYGVADGSTFDTSGAFTNGFLNDPNLNVDAAYPLNSGDLYWSGFFGPNWVLWNELDQTAGYSSSPDRGTNAFASTDPVTGAWIQGQWEESFSGLDELPLQDGSWIGFTVGAAGYDTNNADPATAAYNNNEQAPPSPDGTYVAYVCNTNDFAVQVISSSNLDTAAPYNNPAAMLGRPTLDFFDPADGGVTDLVSIIDDPYNVAPNGSDVIAEIAKGGEVTLMMGRKVCHNPTNPYGIDLIVYGNTAFEASGFVSDATDLNTTTLGAPFGHSAMISVSQDGTNWVSLGNTPTFFPDNAYRWDEPNQSWTSEYMNPTKPLDPAVTEASLDGSTAAHALDEFIGASGGTGISLAGCGLPWIQYVRIQPPANTDTVIDAVAAVDPMLEGDALSIAPGDVASGVTNLFFQAPYDTHQTLIALGFASVSQAAKISTVPLSDFSPFAPVPGVVENACQITAEPVLGTNAVTVAADLALSAGNYTGNGSDLRVLQWSGSSWTEPAFAYNSTNNQVCLAGVTNLSAFVVAQLSPTLSIVPVSNGYDLQFLSFADTAYMLQRSTDLINWVCVTNITPASIQWVTLQDPNAPATQAFYRLQVTP